MSSATNGMGEPGGEKKVASVRNRLESSCANVEGDAGRLLF